MLPQLPRPPRRSWRRRWRSWRPISRASGEELAALKSEREKDAAAHGELQGRLAERSKELSAAKDSNADLELKLVTLTQTLDGAREQEVALKEKIKADEALLASAATAQNTFRENVEH